MIKGMTCLARRLGDLLLRNTRAPQRLRNLYERTKPTQKQAQVKAKGTSKKTYKNQHKNLEGWRRSNELLGGGPENWLKELREFANEEEGKDDVQFKPIRPGLRGIQGHMCSEMGGKRGQE